MRHEKFVGKIQFSSPTPKEIRDLSAKMTSKEVAKHIALIRVTEQEIKSIEEKIPTSGFQIVKITSAIASHPLSPKASLDHTPQA